MFQSQSSERLAVRDHAFASPRRLRVLWVSIFSVLQISTFVVTNCVSADEPKRYTAMLEDGTRVEADDFANWYDDKQKPTLAQKFIFHENNPARWIIDRTQIDLPLGSVATSDAESQLEPTFVEFAGGDRLPGRVVGAFSGRESSWNQQPETLLVEPSLELNWPDYGAAPAIRVRSSMLRRVVWQRRSNRKFSPLTAFLRDGRAVKFRSARWSRDQLRALTEDGLKTFRFEDLSEVHLEAGDPWENLFNQLAILTPTGTARLVQVETASGLIATTSTERFQARFRGDKNKADNWYQLLQPAWSLDPLYVRFRQIRAWRFSWPHQVPLSAISPSGITHRPTFGSAWVWRTNRSVKDTPLRLGSDSAHFGWGVGVSAFHELRFNLPPQAIAFRTRFGLDSSVGGGGCVQPTIQMVKPDGGTTNVFSGKIIVGSSVGDTGRIAIAKGSKEVRLIVDPVLQDRPRGADPFDIRDFFNWAEPEVWLDPNTLKQELAKRTVLNVAALRGWSISPVDQSELDVVNYWDEIDSRDPRYRRLLSTNSTLVRMTRQMTVDRATRWVGLAVASPPLKEVTPPKFQIRVAGEALGAFVAPSQASTLVDPVLFPVERFRGKDVTVEVLVSTGGKNSLFDWNGGDMTSQRPGLLRVFEDELQFVKDLKQGEAEITLATDEPYKGTACVQMSPGHRGAERLRGLNAKIRENPEFGEYRYIRFYWRKKGGNRLAMTLANNGQLQTEDGDALAVQNETSLFDPRGRRLATDLKGLQNGFRYLAGSPIDEYKTAIRVRSSVPTVWDQVHRDLYVDMGNFTLTGLRLECPDGEWARLDHVYLARRATDFNYVDEQLKPYEPGFSNDPNIARLENEPTRYSEVLTTVAPLFSTPLVGGGIALIKEHRGKKNVVRTLPIAPKKPCVLQASVTIPPGKKTRLETNVSYMNNGDWHYIVYANGNKIHDSLVSESTTKDGWLDINVDLTRFAGQDVYLEVHNHPNNWPNEAAFFSKLHVVSE